MQYISSVQPGPNWLRPVGTRSGSEPIETGFRTAMDCRGPVLPVPVHGSRIFVINMTGSVPGSSQKGLRTGTGPDFKALPEPLIIQDRRDAYFAQC